MCVSAYSPVSTVVLSPVASKQPGVPRRATQQGMSRPVRPERVPTQQTTLQPGTAGNGISGGLQMCQLECERHVRYANEVENRLAWHAWPIYSTAACHSDARPVRESLWWL